MAASSQDRDASDGFSPRLATFYAAMFVFAGIVMPFFPVWLQAKGLDSRATGIVPILLAVALASVATAPALPLTDAYALKGLGLRGRAYGPVRLWGSVAFVAANLGAGLVVDRIAPIHIIWLLVAALVMVAAVSLALRPLAAAPPPREELSVPGRKLLLSPGFWAITAAASLIQASHAVYYGFSVLDWRAKGLDATSIGGLWGLAVIAEIGRASCRE